MLLRCVLPLAVLASVLRAEVLEFELKAGASRTVQLASKADDTNFTEPRGYAGHGTRTRSFIQRIELTNTGDKALTGRLLTIDERDWTRIEGLQQSLGLSAEPHRQALTMERLFSFWKNHRSHAGSGSQLAYEPFAALNFWGYTLCGEDTQALARLAHAFDIPARHVQLNGHLAGEYRYDGKWHMVDGDQNAVYLRLDNQGFASADELRADPFLALRTKVFGRHSRQEIAASAFNCALIEHVNPVEPKAIKIKAGPAPLNVFTIHPAESLIWHCGTPPESPVGKVQAEKPDVVRDALLATIEHRALARHYKQGEAGAITVGSPFPIWKAVNQTTGAAVPLKSDEIAFRVTIPVKGEADQISIYSQCSRTALPIFHRDDNFAKLEAKEGKARVAVHYAPAKNVVLPNVKLSATTANFPGLPSFSVGEAQQADRLWWQVSSHRDFSFVAPSLEGVVAMSPDLRFDPLTNTFLSPDTAYYVRAKAAQAGVWGEWSESVQFKVSKPAPPTEAAFESAGGSHVRLSWKTRGKGLISMIYGSNRRDFVPEAFTDTEIVAMDHLKVIEERENRNLLASTKETEHEFVPKHRFYRIICRAGESVSVPGPLLVLPDELAKDLPPPTVLQVRAARKGDLDIYRAQEEKLRRTAVTAPGAGADPAKP